MGGSNFFICVFIHKTNTISITNMLLFLKSLCGYGTAIYFHQIGSEVGMAKRRVKKKERTYPTRAQDKVTTSSTSAACRIWGASKASRMWGGLYYGSLWLVART